MPAKGSGRRRNPPARFFVRCYPVNDGAAVPGSTAGGWEAAFVAGRQLQSAHDVPGADPGVGIPARAAGEQCGIVERLIEQPVGIGLDLCVSERRRLRRAHQVLHSRVLHDQPLGLAAAA